MHLSPYFNSRAVVSPARKFDDFGILPSFHLVIIDRWLERADDSEPIPTLSVYGPVASERTESSIEAVEVQNEARVLHSQPIESFQTLFNPQNITSPVMASSRHSLASTVLTSDASRCFLSLEEPTTPTPMPPRKRPRFTPINQAPRLSASSILSGEGVEQFGLRSPNLKSGKLRTPLSDAEPVNNVTILPTSTLPDRLRSLFPYDYFNAMQSKAFHSIYASDHNIVLSAPTGSGKTACFEFAIARLMSTDLSSIGKFKVWELTIHLIDGADNLYWTHKIPLPGKNKRLESKIWRI